MTLCLGMSGEYVERVQQFLSRVALYHGPIDSSYGGGTFAAVKVFQLREGLPTSGMVDAATWARMFPGQPPPVCGLLAKSLCDRCLALTGSFETSAYPPDSFSGLSGDFDRMGISFGVCQWNIGQGTLQPLLEAMFEQYPVVARSVFHEYLDTLAELRTAELGEQLAFARSIQYKGQVNEPWRGMFVTLGRTPEFQDIQTRAASDQFKLALELAGRFGLTSERAAALMFDVLTQNGSINAIASQDLLWEIAQLPSGEGKEVSSMVMIGNRVAEQSAADHVEDVRTRKLTIARGVGNVHGYYYDLSEMFGIGLTAV